MQKPSTQPSPCGGEGGDVSHILNVNEVQGRRSALDLNYHSRKTSFQLANHLNVPSGDANRNRVANQANVGLWNKQVARQFTDTTILRMSQSTFLSIDVWSRL